MKNQSLILISFLMLCTACADDTTSSPIPCTSDSDCTTVCVNDFCAQTGSTTGEGGSLAQGGNVGELGESGSEGEDEGIGPMQGGIIGGQDNGAAGSAGGNTADSGDVVDEIDTNDGGASGDEVAPIVGGDEPTGGSADDGDASDNDTSTDETANMTDEDEQTCLDDARANLSTETALEVSLPAIIDGMRLCTMTTDWYRFNLADAGTLTVTVNYENGDTTLYTGLKWDGDTIYHPINRERNRIITQVVTPGEYLFVVGNMSDGEPSTNYRIQFEFRAENGSGDNEGDAGSSGGTGNSGDAGNTGGADNSGDAGNSGESGSSGDADPNGVANCDLTTQPLPAAATFGAYAPSARIDSMSVPATPEEATTANCRSAGSNNGTGLSSLLNLLNASDLSQFYDIESNTAIHQLLHFDGWMAGESGDQASPLSLNVYGGIYFNGNMRANPLSFDTDGNPLNQYSANITGCELEAQGDSFSVLPGGGANADLELLANLAITHVHIFGDVNVGNDGVGLSNASINGYIHRDALIELVDGLKMLCMSSSPPAFCGQFSAFLNSSSTFIVNRVLAPMLRGFDAQITDAETVTGNCNPATCNAVSVCLSVEASPIQVD